MTISEKLKAIRHAEGLTQMQLCEIMGISISTFKKIEAGYNDPALATIIKITSHPQFEKYSLWLITDKTAPEAGQISPTLSPDGAEKAPSDPLDRKIG
ncbi:helix-turn-helix domain-containing protein [Morganella morganii]|uniref:helix-turn-helix domain-containing protein n=1 Tax=Morganella morganii TaxID=582 RepID=UPI001C479A19|nr:helix-turn-helix transcriptional regulator [Morganella morganii]QXO61593.1 helix-turn-helix transcriptional regulator [Morganella morganii]QXO69066.1 helix-turn-helix transcriptional regulator [Morganella morganii]